VLDLKHSVTFWTGDREVALALAPAEAWDDAANMIEPGSIEFIKRPCPEGISDEEWLANLAGQVEGASPVARGFRQRPWDGWRRILANRLRMLIPQTPSQSQACSGVGPPLTQRTVRFRNRTLHRQS
jgi:hypothetical protein